MIDRKFIRLHIIRHQPFGLANRDDCGNQKVCYFGGALRIRWSSQMQNRSFRLSKEFAYYLEEFDLGKRVKHIGEFLLNYLSDKYGIEEDLQKDHLKWIFVSSYFPLIMEGTEPKSSKIKSRIDWSKKLFENLEEGLALKKAITKTNGDFDLTNSPLATGATSFYHHAELEKLKEAAEMLVEELDENNCFKENGDLHQGNSKDFLTNKATVSAYESHIYGSVSKSPDVILFGRFLASLIDQSRDGSLFSSHAISITEAQQEIDTFTAVDDYFGAGEGRGASHIGNREMDRALMYQSFAIDEKLLSEGLDDPSDATKVVKAFVVTALSVQPGAMQRPCLADNAAFFARIEITNKNPMTYQMAFEEVLEENALLEGVRRLRARAEGYRRSFIPGDYLEYIDYSIVPEIEDTVPLLDVLDFLD